MGQARKAREGIGQKGAKKVGAEVGGGGGGGNRAGKEKKRLPRSPDILTNASK